MDSGGRKKKCEDYASEGGRIHYDSSPNRNPSEFEHYVNDGLFYEGYYHEGEERDPFSMRSISLHNPSTHSFMSNPVAQSSNLTNNSRSNLIESDPRNYSYQGFNDGPQYEPPPSYNEVSGTNENDESEIKTRPLPVDNQENRFVDINSRQFDFEENQYQTPIASIYPAKHFDPHFDARRIRKEFSRIFGSNTFKVFLELMCNRSQSQRLEVVRCLEHDYGMKIQNYFKPGNLRTVVIPLISSQGDGDAFIIYESICFPQVNVISLIDIFCTRTRKEISSLKISYKLIYKKSFESVKLKKIPEEFKIFMMKLFINDRNEEAVVTPQQAVDAFTELKLISSHTQLSSFFAIRSFSEIREAIKMYKNKLGVSAFENVLIKFAQDGIYRHALEVIYTYALSPTEAYLMLIKDAVQNNRPGRLFRCLLKRSEIDLISIVKLYEKRYGRNIIDDISIIMKKTDPRVQMVLKTLCGYPSFNIKK